MKTEAKPGIQNQTAPGQVIPGKPTILNFRNQQWMSFNANIGLRSGRFPGIDIDVG